MACLPPATAAAASTTTRSSSSFSTNTCTLSSWLLCSKTSRKSTFDTLRKRTRLFKLSCKHSGKDDQNQPETSLSLDRRNMLLGLGGLCGAINMSPVGSSLAAPVAAPDITDCGKSPLSGFNVTETTPTNGACCPPNITVVKEYKLPMSGNALRIRPAAHLASPEYVAKFNEAIKRMKELPADDPRNFMQQANIHCAYCNGGYSQLTSGFPDIEIQVHNSWLFFPFHRWYLYFFERILGRLIDDPSLALPFWNWDTPEGMYFPSMFMDSNSAIYDPLRDQNHLSAVIDLNFNGYPEASTTDQQKVSNNLSLMYRGMVSSATSPLLFFGSPYQAGDLPSPGGGSIERIPHTPVHSWSGDPNQPNGENLGNFYSSARDPLFYSHHANLDRLWSVWKTLGGKHEDLNEPDWLNSSFLFYDENKDLVRVYVKDCLDMKKLGYGFQNVDMPWLKSKPVSRAPRSGIAAKSAGKVTKIPDVKFPVNLDKLVKVLVERPKKSRSKKEKEKEDEVLIIDGIMFNSEKYTKFDVFVNDENHEGSAPDQMEFAGSFAQLPHKHKHLHLHKHKKMVSSSLRLCLTEQLEELGADDDDYVLVTLVPRTGCEDITISGIKIELTN